MHEFLGGNRTGPRQDAGEVEEAQRRGTSTQEGKQYNFGAVISMGSQHESRQLRWNGSYAFTHAGSDDDLVIWEW